MLIDWFTVGAQVLNFLILVWLLKRFLYKPILDAIDARETRIAAEIGDADAKRVEAEKERENFEKKNEEFDRARAGFLLQAEGEAAAERERLLEEARQAANAWSSKHRDALSNEARSLNEDISRRAQEEVFAIARKTLLDLAGSTLEERMSEVFTRRLRALDDEAKQGLAASLNASSELPLVRSAFELPPEQRAAICQALNESCGVETELRFETAPELVSGIELTTHGQKVAWSISDYLGSLKKSVSELLEEEASSETVNDGDSGPKREAIQ